MTQSSNQGSQTISDDTESLRTMDAHVVHPWECFDRRHQEERTFITRGQGVYVHDSEGNRLIDGPAGMWCVNIGHGREEMAQSIARQAMELDYFSPWSLSNAPAAKLAERLSALSPGDLNNVLFTTGGSTAVDSALRFVAFYNNLLGRPNKKKIISRVDAYHGSTYLAASCSGKPGDKPNMDFADDLVCHIPSPNPRRRPEGMTLDAFRQTAVDDLESRINELGEDNVAAFIAEPIMASGGVIVPPSGYQRDCLEVCRKYNVLYISDEVVTGFGRLGHIFASQAVFDITPDIITCAKGLTSGYVPLGAVLISDRLLEDIGVDEDRGAIFTNGFTYSAHPVSCAAALTNLDIIEREHILDHVNEVIPYFQQKLHSLGGMPGIVDVRGIGLMACIECDSDIPELSKLIDRHCQSLGLIVRPIGNMCVMSPPLVITAAQIDDMVDILRQGIARASGEST